MSSLLVLTGTDLPGFHRDAERVAARGQKLTLRYSRARAVGAVVAAIGGALSWSMGAVDAAAAVIASGFLVALAAELISWNRQPEQDWYSGRALAESAKTLAWRYAVQADPFPASMGVREAHGLMRDRLREVHQQVAGEVLVSSPSLVVTARMDELRAAAFEERREAYRRGRTEDQLTWYSRKAEANRRAATGWRAGLVVAELLAVVLASLRVFGGWDVDFAGVLGAVIAASAGWLALKQHSTLATAYTTTAVELGLQLDRLAEVTEPEWSAFIADAEEAISREHILWLASRTGKRPLDLGR